MNVSLRQLRAFISVAEQQNFTKAAESLYLTQSSLSSLIKDLEENLGVRLFDRTTRQLTLSHVGEDLLPYAKRVLNELQMFENEAQSMTSLQRGRIRIALSQQLASSIFPALLASFWQAYPNIQVTLMDSSVDEVIELVQTTEADLGIAAERDYNATDVQAEYLFDLPFYVVMPADHPLTLKPQVDWQDLTDEPLVTLRGPFTYDLRDDLPKDIAAQILSPRFEANSMSTIMPMVQQRLGLTLCMAYAADWVEQQGLQMRQLVNPIVRRRFYLYQRKSRSLTPAVATFNEFFHQQLPNSLAQIQQAIARNHGSTFNQK